MGRDGLALVASYVYVFLILAIGEALRRLRIPVTITRKVVHIGVGMWVVGTVLLFEERWAAIIPPLTFVVINALSYRRQIFRSMETQDRQNLGTVYFPLAFAIVIAVFWAKPAVVVAGLMPMVWGDPLAAVVGRRTGRHPYTLAGFTKSWEGTLTMAVVSTLAVGLALAAWGLDGAMMAGAAIATGLVAALVEGISVFGLDNLTVPLASAILLWMLIP